MLTPQDQNILNRDPIANMSMIGFFSKQFPTKILRRGDSIMAQGKSDEDWWYLSLAEQSDFDWFVEQTAQEDNYLAAIDDMILDKVKKKFTCRWVLSCQRFFLPNEVIILDSDIPISKLTQKDAKHIYKNSNYKTFTNENYIEEQIKNGPGSGFRDGSILAGWVLTHDDGALGALHVLDTYRRKGIAKAIVIDLIKKVRGVGLIPYTYVEPSNTASMELVKSLGFLPDRPIHWACLNR